MRVKGVSMLLALHYWMGDVHHCSWTPPLQNDLYCVEWDVKPYYTIPYLCYLCFISRQETVNDMLSYVWTVKSSLHDALILYFTHVSDTDSIDNKGNILLPATPKVVTPKLHASKLLLSTASMRMHRYVHLVNLLTVLGIQYINKINQIFHYYFISTTGNN